MLTLNFHPFPVLCTQRLTLRSITLDDAAALYSLRTNPLVLKYLDRAMPSSIEEVVTQINNIQTMQLSNQAISWAITLNGKHDMIGTIGYWKITSEHYRAEIGYTLSPNYHGKGIMYEALCTVLQHGFKEMKLHSVEANVNPGNDASKGLLEKTGFVQEAYFKENYYYNGKFLDSAIYSLIAPN